MSWLKPEGDLQSPERLRELLQEQIARNATPPVQHRIHLWRLLGWTLGAILAAFIAEFLVLAYWHAFNRGQSSSFDQNGALAAFRIVVDLTTVTAVLAIGLRVNGHPVCAYLALVRPVFGWTAVVLVAVVMLWPALLLFGALTVGPPAGVLIYRQMYQSAATAGALPLVWLAFIVAAPLCEEIIFRGFLFRALIEAPLRARWVVLITSFLWVWIHPSSLAFLISVFLLGLLLGSLRQVTGSIIPTIAVHAIINTVVMVVFGMGTGPTPDGWHRQFTHEGGFSVAFPRIPEYRSEQSVSPKGETFTRHQYAVGRDRGSFVVLTRTLPPGIGVTDARAALQGIADTTPTFAYESQTWRSVKGVDALETVSVQNNRRTRALLMITNQGFITAGYSAALDAPIESPDIEAFINSVRPER